MTRPRRPPRTFFSRPALPLAPAHRHILEWLPVNRGFYANFRTWLYQSGYGPSALNRYGVAARLVLGLLDIPYWQMDPVADVDKVRNYIRTHYESAGTVGSYLAGIAKFEEYLRRRCHTPKPEKALNWPHYVDALPSWMAEDVKAYLAHCRRNWPLEKRYERTMDTTSQLTVPLRGMAAQAPLSSYADLTPQLWFTYVDARLNSGISIVTTNNELRALQSWLRFLEELGKAVNPRLLLVKELDEGDRLPRDVPVEQVRAFWQAIESAAGSSHAGVRRLGVMDRAWFLMMIHSGLRTGEIRRLKLADVDWENKRVRIEQSKGLKDRSVPLSAATLDALNAYLAVRGPLEDLPENLFIFRHGPFSESYCYERLRTYGKSLGIKATPHQFRHSCATLLLNAGAPILTVQAILGHKFVETTLGYARLYDGTVAADYYRAMVQVEQCLALKEDEVRPLMSHGELLALVDSLRGGTLNEVQSETVRTLRAGISALAMREAGMRLLKGETPALDEVVV